MLSHDLLEGCYLRCGLASDILLMDGYPTKYNSFMNRLSRWIRGDWQITKWIGWKSPLNLLSKYKIVDNLRRSVIEISIILAVIYCNILGAIEVRRVWWSVSMLLRNFYFSISFRIAQCLYLPKRRRRKAKDLYA